jgi:predicted Zn-dependent peptidase
LVYGEIKSVDELLRRIDAVTVKDVADLAAQVLDAPLSIAAVGPFDSVDQLRRAVS